MQNRVRPMTSSPAPRSNSSSVSDGHSEIRRILYSALGADVRQPDYGAIALVLFLLFFFPDPLSLIPYPLLQPLELRVHHFNVEWRRDRAVAAAGIRLACLREPLRPTPLGVGPRP